MPEAFSDATVIAVHRSFDRGLVKDPVPSIQLLAGLGVEGDVHLGALIRHASRMRKDPSKPNLRQIHLIHAELQDELAARGLPVEPGQMGENITTRGIDLLGLPTGTRLIIGPEAVVEVKGLRNPCVALDSLHTGMMEAVLDRAEDGALIRRSGVMGVVLKGGEIRPGDRIRAELPAERIALGPV